MIRQFGPCTSFVTLSSADLKWTDTIRIIAKQQGRQLTDEDIQCLSWKEKCQYLRSDPVTAARHFDYRMNVFFKQILFKEQISALGEVMVYKRMLRVLRTAKKLKSYSTFTKQSHVNFQKLTMIYMT